jgi:hypothetical protein
MRIFIVSCLVAAVVATGCAFILFGFQESAATAFSTSAVRL